MTCEWSFEQAHEKLGPTLHNYNSAISISLPIKQRRPAVMLGGVV
jgi:hypothetical protein